MPAPGAGAEAAGVYTVYVGASKDGVLQRVEFRPGTGAEVVRTTPVGRVHTRGEGPHGVRIGPGPGGDRVYVTSGDGPLDGALWIYDAGPDTLVGREVRLGSYPATVAVTPDGLFAFVTRSSLRGDLVPGGVSVVYTDELREAARTPTCGMPRGGRIGPSGTRHYSVCAVDDRLVEIDTRTYGVVRSLGLRSARRGRCGASWAEPSPDGQTVYVACAEADRIYEVDRVTWEIDRVMPTGRGPFQLAATPDGRLLLATLRNGDAVELFDILTGQPLARVPTVGDRPHGVVVSSDSRYAFVSVEGIGGRPGRVDVYALSPLRRVASAAVGRGAAGIDVRATGR
ncbi:MAG: YncE family protein [Candidatus Longimicrobiales bacterium M2_2A_002]